MLVARSLQSPDYVLRDLAGGQDTTLDLAGQNLRTGRVNGMLSPDGAKYSLPVQERRRGRVGRSGLCAGPGPGRPRDQPAASG